MANSSSTSDTNSLGKLSSASVSWNVNDACGPNPYRSVKYHSDTTQPATWKLDGKYSVICYLNITNCDHIYLNLEAENLDENSPDGLYTWDLMISTDVALSGVTLNGGGNMWFVDNRDTHALSLVEGLKTAHVFRIRTFVHEGFPNRWFVSYMYSFRAD